MKFAPLPSFEFVEIWDTMNVGKSNLFFAIDFEEFFKKLPLTTNVGQHEIKNRENAISASKSSA